MQPYLSGECVPVDFPGRSARLTCERRENNAVTSSHTGSTEFPSHTTFVPKPSSTKKTKQKGKHSKISSSSQKMTTHTVHVHDPSAKSVVPLKPSSTRSTTTIMLEPVSRKCDCNMGDESDDDY